MVRARVVPACYVSRKDKFDARWRGGVWLGMRMESGEFLFGAREAVGWILIDGSLSMEPDEAKMIMTNSLKRLGSPTQVLAADRS